MNDPKPEVPPPSAAAPSPWWFRALLVALGLAAWFWTQSIIGQRALSGQAIGDELHVLTAPAYQYLLDHPRAANGLLIVSSAFIDQALCALPPPEEMIWHNPGLPSLVVTYSVANDLFFSGHTAIAVFGAVELARLGRRWLGVLGVGVALFEVAAVLTLRAHYTMDVFTGAVTALLVAGVAAKISPWCDRALAGLTGRKPGGADSAG